MTLLVVESKLRQCDARYKLYYPMKLIKTYSVGRAQELVVDLIKKWGHPTTTEDGEKTLQIEPLCIQIDTPMSEPRIACCSSYGEAFLKSYTDKVLNGYMESEFDYDYHSRLCNYDGKVNQIDYIVSKLREEPTSRRAMAITWSPVIDTHEKNCPCLQYIQATVNNGKLDMLVLFRSNDMLSAFGCNAYAMTMLQKTIADKLGITVGTYTHISVVPHIYHIRDKSELERYG